MVKKEETDSGIELIKERGPHVMAVQLAEVDGGLGVVGKSFDAQRSTLVSPQSVFRHSTVELGTKLSASNPEKVLKGV